MRRYKLGLTGIEVTELCFGALPMGPMQKNLDVEYGTAIVARALKGGINFVDTAQAYKTYVPIKKAMEETGIVPIIASKSNAAEYNEMEDAVSEALEMLGLKKIDIFHIHAARGDKNLFRIRAGALRALLDLKEKGTIKAVGVSCHSAEVVSLAADVKELDIVFPLINYKGMGIIGGSLPDMEKAIIKCREANKGIYLMKILAGGNILGEYDKAIAYARSLGNYPIALGMVSEEEVDYNISFFDSEDTSGFSNPTLKGSNKRFQIVQRACLSCGKCVETCASSAISMIEGKAFINSEKCINCGYCVPGCLVLAIRAI
ncbi:MAG: aldo/keto reductase [Spirochaetaceae bacterium]|nr:aldo/keto reductase [Spirochaetaceae bacterium]